ncbi:DODA-type extradiol aromatic ring-opening family dioxygenase [Granulosicoccus sp. 3-233]|uniref:DODA-type extradiol aromatic ring-opening family dioxygenase n=1 Tax=Granulosicoccus sp. 3-233 TaxID=3417969 RepID=UPI003D35064F
MRLPTFFISHGGGPWPWMDSQQHHYAGLRKALQRMPELIGEQPDAILMISAHWEAPEFTLSSAEHPGMIYDYHGFPEETYSISYPAPGAPWLAKQVRALLNQAGLTAQLDAQRGFDHGMYCPMAVAYPGADIPVVQLSLKEGLDSREHLALGHVLTPLRDQGILIIGSGLSYHNLRHFGPSAHQVSANFDDWVHETLTEEDAEVRELRLTEWESAPSARQAHPREEHLLPLMVATGAARQDKARRVYHQTDFMGGISVSNFQFG